MASVSVGHGQTAEHHVNPLHLLRHLWRQRDLIRQFTRCEIEGRYRGSYLGLVWSFINPLILLLITLSVLLAVNLLVSGVVQWTLALLSVVQDKAFKGEL